MTNNIKRRIMPYIATFVMAMYADSHMPAQAQYQNVKDETRKVGCSKLF